MKVVIAYDVSNDDARARVSARLAAYGSRIQRSVYECFVDAETLPGLLEGLEQLVDVRTDVVHAFPVCAGCAEGRRAIGQDRATVEDAYWVVM